MDSAAPSPAPEGITSAPVLEAAPLPSPSAAPATSPGTVLSQSPESVQENGGATTPVEAGGSIGPDAPSDLEGVVDGKTSLEGAVLPVLVEEGEVPAAAPPPASVAEGEVPGDAVLSPVVDVVNPSFSNEGEGVGEMAADVGSSQKVGSEEVVEEEDSANRRFVGGGDEDEDSSMVKIDGNSEENNPVPDDAVMEVGSHPVEKVESAAVAEDTGNVFAEALAEPLEVQSSDQESAKIESTDNTNADGNVEGETEPMAVEAEPTAMKTEEGAILEMDDAEAPEDVKSNDGSVKKVESTEAIYEEALSEPLPSSVDVTEDGNTESEESSITTQNIDEEKDFKATESDLSATTEGSRTAEADDSEASAKVDLDESSLKNVEAAYVGELSAAEAEDTAGVAQAANDVAIHEEALSKPLEAESSVVEESLSEDVLKSMRDQSDNDINPSGIIGKEDEYNGKEELNSINASETDKERGTAGDAENEEIIYGKEEINSINISETDKERDIAGDAENEEIIHGKEEINFINASETDKEGGIAGDAENEEIIYGKEDINSINASETDKERGIAGDAENEEIIISVPKSPELAIADNSEDILGEKVGNLDVSLATEGVGKGSMQSDSSINLDAVSEIKSSDTHSASEENVESEKVATESRNFGLDAEDNENQAGNKFSEASDGKENGIASPILDNELKPDVADGSQVKNDVCNDDENIDYPEVDEEEEEEEEEKALVSEVAMVESSEVVKQIIREMTEGSSDINANSDYINSRDYVDAVEGQIVTDSDEEVETDEEGEGKELFDSAALAALLKAATGSSADGSITLSSQDGSRIFTMERPAGLGSSVSSLKPAPSRSSRPSIFTQSELAPAREDDSDMNEEDRKLHEQVEQIRVKFLRLVHRLKHSPEDTVAAQVLYRLGLAEGIRRGRQTSRTFDLENAKRKALELEAEGEDDLNFSCNILVIGKSGVGKSATINSIFGEERAQINAFEAATMSVKEVSGIVDGVKVRIIDTPGLRASAMEQSSNRKILSAIKKYTKKCPPDIVLYVDRLDSQTRDLNDLPLLRSITSTLGSSIWFNAIVALTHAASAPPDGPNGSPLSYEVFLAQRSHVVQHLIRQAAGDMRLMNPVALVENHSSCRRNKEGEKVLPNGLSWRPQMLLLCYSSKILSEANSLLKLQEPSPGKLFGFRMRSPPLPVLLSSLLQSRVHPKLSADQGGGNGDSDLDLDDFSDADEEEDEDEYDQLPPFKPLRKAQIAKLTREQRKAYFEEYDYRVKLLQKKQLKEEIRRMKEMKKKGKSSQDDFSYGDMGEDDQYAAPAAVPVPLPDMVLPPSFDCESPVYRYRFLEPTSQLLTRPVLDTHSWDHDCGYDGVSIEHSIALSGCFPAGVAVQITKDKKDFNIHLDSSVAMKHGQNASTLACFEIQPVGRQLAYTVRGETKFKNLKKNKPTAGISVTFLGETVATGLKVEDQLSIGKRLALVASTGAVRAQGDMAYGANLEARLRDKDFPIGQALTTLGLSLMKWRGDLALGANLQSQFSVGRSSKMAVRVGLNNKLSGQISVKTSTSEQLQIALVGILPIAASLFRTILSGESYSSH